MKINRKFTPVSLELEYESEVEFLKELCSIYLQYKQSIWTRPSKETMGEQKAKYLFNLLEKL